MPPEPVPEPVEPQPEAPLRPEARPEVSPFLSEVAGYSRLLLLRGNEVQFVDEENAPIGDPIIVETIDGVDPGPLDERGLPIEGIRSAWLDAARLRLKESYPHLTVDLDADLPRQLNVVAQFRSALAQEDEPELVAGIQSGQIETYHDIVSYFADQPVVGAEEFSRFEYIKDQVRFSEAVPRAVTAELASIIPALCIQESGFNNDLESKAGAKGIFQIMPDTWNEYCPDPERIERLTTQVEVASQFFSDLYQQLQYWIGEPQLEMLRIMAGSDDRFYREVMTPLLVNAYNAGARRLGEAVSRYLAENDVLDDFGEPFGLFQRIADYAIATDDGVLANYGPEARKYVPQIYGHREAIKKLRSV